MKRTLLGSAIALVAMVVCAAPAMAAAPTDPGYMEICKYSSTLSGTPTFTFNVSGVSASITVANNSCSAPFSAPDGTDTVTEVPGSWYAVSGITTNPGSALISSNLAGGTATVSVAPSTSPTTATIVSFTNTIVTGYIEVCKSNAADSAMTGSWSFTITGHNAFSDTASVPIGHCSLPILVPAGAVSVAETPGTPASVTSITVQNGAPSTTSLGSATAGVTVKASGDTTQEAIVTFFNDPVALKICKFVTPGSGITAAYTFTAVGNDPTLGTITRTVSVLPGQCQIVPGPYTNPNGTTGWRAGTPVAVSEGVIPGTSVSAITVATAGSAAAPVLSPVPMPSLPGPAGSQALVLGSGETTVAFTNTTDPNGTLKICEVAGAGLPSGSPLLFTISSPTPAGSSTTAVVPAGSCTIVANPATSDGGWLYNSTVTITQTPVSGEALAPPITVSPTASLLSQSGATAVVAMGDFPGATVVTYTNDPAAAAPAAPAPPAPAAALAAPAASAGSLTTTAGTPVLTVSPHAIKAHVAYAHVVKKGGKYYLVVRVNSTKSKAQISVTLFGSKGKKLRSMKLTIATGRAVSLKLAQKPKSAAVVLL